MAGRAHGSQKIGRTRWATAIAAAATTAAVVAAVAWQVSGSLAASRPRAGGSPATEAGRVGRLGGLGSYSGTPLDRASTPAGWAAVPYRSAQLSVPGLWLVETPSDFFCGVRSGGMIFTGMRPGIQKGTGCRLTASYAWILPAGTIPLGISHRKPTAVINGVPVYRRPAGRGSVLYLVPELGVRVGAHGPLAKRVLATLNRSPLSVVLGKGKAAAVPVGWARHRFGGVAFAAPRAWRRYRQTQWATCGTGLLPRTLLLIDAIKPSPVLPCPYPVPYADALAAQPGLTAVTGKFAAGSVGEQFTRCQQRHGERICLAAVTGEGGFLSGVLIFSVSRPHHHPAAFFLLGLSGSGASARAIFDSVTLPSTR